MNKNILFYLLSAVAVISAVSCSRKPFKVERVEVPEGRSFRICLNEAPPAEQPYFYSIQFITKDKFRYTIAGSLSNATGGTENCFTETKFRYDMSAYADETIRAIENISNQTLDTCRIQIYSDNQLEPSAFVFEKIFTAEDFQ